MDYLEALECFLQEFIFENDKTDVPFNQKFNALELPGTDFVSAFRVRGIPILPPLMTESRRQQMRTFRQEAIFREESRRKSNFRTITSNTGSAKPDGVMAFDELGLGENEETKGLFRGMANEESKSLYRGMANGNLVNMDFKNIGRSDVSSCHHKLNHMTSDTRFIVNDDRNLTRPTVEFIRHKMSTGKLQTSTEEPKSKGFDLQDQFVKKDFSEFITTDQLSSNNVIYCDSQTFRDSGTHSTFSCSAVDKSNSSSVTVVTNRFHRPAECSHPKSSIDSGLCSKDMTTITSDSAVNHDDSETLDEESYLTSNEDRLDNSMFEVQTSIIVKSSSISSENSLPVGDDDGPYFYSALDTVPDEQNILRDGLSCPESRPSDICNERSLEGLSTAAEQMTYDECVTSKDSVSSTFSGESNEMIRTVIDCKDCNVPSSSAGANLCEKKMFKYAGSNDCSCSESDEQTIELNEELSNNSTESCLTLADVSVQEKLSQHLGEVCPRFIKDFKLHIEKGNGDENEDDENCKKVGEERDEERDNVGIEVEEEKEEDEEETEREEKLEGAEAGISDKWNPGEITHFDKAEEKLKESEDDVGNDFHLRQQLNLERDLKQRNEDKHELGSEEQPEEKELQQERALICLADKEKKHCLEIASETNVENNLELERVMEQEKDFNEDVKDNAAQQEKQNAEKIEEKKTSKEDKTGQKKDLIIINTDENDDFLPGDKTKRNVGSLLEERRLANDLKSDECGEDVSFNPMPSHVSLEKKVAQVLCKLDKYHDTQQTVGKESNPSSSTSDPSAILPTAVVCQADSSVSLGPLKDSHAMPSLLPTFSANTELAPYLVSLLAGDTIENCMTMILVDRDLNRVPLDYLDSENVPNHESGNEQVLSPARLRRNSYVIPSSEVSQVTESECPTSDGLRKLRRGSYTLENPSETLQPAEFGPDTDPDRFLSIKNTDVNCTPPSTKTLTKTMVNSFNPLLVGETEQSSSAVTRPEADDSEAIAMATKKARIRSEQVGKLEHLRRYLQQVSDMGAMETSPSESILQDERSEMDYVSKGAAGNGVHLHQGQVSPADAVLVAHSRPRAVNFEMGCRGDTELDDQSSYDLPVYMSEEDAQKEFNRKISEIKEKHQRDLARLIAGQQLVLQREIMLHEEQLTQKKFRTKKARSSKQSGTSSRNAVDYERRNVNADAMVACDRSQSVMNCAGDGIDRQRVYTDNSHPLASRSATTVALDRGDSHVIVSTAPAAPVYFEEKRTVSPAVSLSTLQSEDNESEFAFKSPAVLRQAKNTHSSCSPKAPMYSSPALRHRTSLSEVPSTGGNAHSSPADDNAKVLSDVWKKLEGLPALVKGYLTRRLMKTERVQSIIQTIQDTAMFALHFQLESPMKKGFYSMQDRRLHERVLAQLTAAMYEIHEIFFEISIKERMLIISHSRALRKEKLFKETRSSVDKKKRMSAATLKTIERRRKGVKSEGCAKQQSKVVSKDNSRKSTTPDRMTSVATACQTKPQNDVRPIRSQSSPRNTGKENVHRILGKEKSRVVASNTSSKPKMQGCNVKGVKKTTILAPARKVARMTNKQTEDQAAVKQLNCYNYDNAEATHDRKHVNLHQKEAAPGKALMSDNHRKLSPNSNPNYWLNPQVGAVLYDSDSHSPTNSLNGSQDNFSKMMTSNQRHIAKSCAVQEKDMTRKIASVGAQSRFS